MSIAPANFCENVHCSQLGEILTEKHIGKRVVRVAPYRNDTTNCYYKGASIDEVAVKLDAIRDDKLEFSFVTGERPTKRYVPQKWNDGNWVTVDTLREHLK
ncbi:MAG: hypothetical protein JSR37_03950 [Verrucomicrobia bacterium]|nr:hypothetical protein [Verrucomicrobiota bacterium]MBS0637183.1 hypothetical protein [Verrucomicrobiota bacterium]